MLYRFRPLRGLHCNSEPVMPRAGARVPPGPKFGKAGTLSEIPFQREGEAEVPNGCPNQRRSGVKRDMDLARRIMEQIEDFPAGVRQPALNLLDTPDEVVQYHLMLLTEAGLIVTVNVSGMSGPNRIPQRLTWEGHEFLETARDSTMWQRAKAIVQNGTGGLAFEVLLAVLKDQALRAVMTPVAE